MAWGSVIDKEEREGAYRQRDPHEGKLGGHDLFLGSPQGLLGGGSEGQV